MRNVHLSRRTSADIDGQVEKILRGLGNPEPPIKLEDVRQLLKLDRAYYSTADDGALREIVSRLKVAGAQILSRPTILRDAIQSMSLKALYLPDQKRILLDADLPKLKHRWNEAHEIGHDIIPWHADMLIGDTEDTLTLGCHAQMEAEANFAAGQILFGGDRFVEEARSLAPTFETVRNLHNRFGNTITSTFWRYIERTHPELPMVGLVTGHPHTSRRKPTFDPANPCRYYIQSPAFSARFASVRETDLFRQVSEYCGSQKGGPLGASEILLQDMAGTRHAFAFETFFNSWEALTLGVWLKEMPVRVVL